MKRVSLAVAALFVLPVAGSAQEVIEAVGASVVASTEVHAFPRSTPRPLIAHDGPFIVVHLAENRVFLFEGTEAVWSAPAGTGNGFRLETREHRWKFTTPRGVFRVRRMEKDPMWEAPDWHFVEKGVPIPPDNHPSRLMPGVMGNTAIYLGDGIAIHGTNAPALVLEPDPEKRRVSHGCIRLTNEDARTLMHRVEVGTPVLVF